MHAIPISYTCNTVYICVYIAHISIFLPWVYIVFFTLPTGGLRTDCRVLLLPHSPETLPPSAGACTREERAQVRLLWWSIPPEGWSTGQLPTSASQPRSSTGAPPLTGPPPQVGCLLSVFTRTLSSRLSLLTFIIRHFEATSRLIHPPSDAVDEANLRLR